MPTKKNPVPKKLSDHDERSEGLAVDKHWDEESHDPAAQAGKHLAQFKQDGVALDPEDWDEEEAKDDKIPDHIDEALDNSLEHLAEKELEEDEEVE